MKKYLVEFVHTDGSVRTVNIEAFSKERAIARFEVNWGPDMKLISIELA